MKTYTHDEDRRNNPELKADCNRVIEARRKALLKAAKTLAEVRDELNHLMLDGDDALYNRCRDDVWTAAYRLEQDAKFLDRDANDTKLGNAASGMLGEYIQKFGLPTKV